jgi:hypothetical protein
MRVASLQIDSNARLECINATHYFISVMAAKATLEKNSELIIYVCD